jgi:hypothetical protein
MVAPPWLGLVATMETERPHHMAADRAVFLAGLDAR